ARRQLRAASEAAADEASLVVADGPRVLATCLVELGGRLTRPRPAGWVAMAGSGFRSSLGRRVERLVELGNRSWRPPGRVRWRLTILLGTAVLCAAAIASTAWARPQAFSTGDQPMLTKGPLWKRSLGGLVLSAVLGMGTDQTLAGDPPTSAADQPPPLRQTDDGKAGADRPLPPPPAG